MADAKDPWFVIERSEALATLLLTGRADVVVVNRREREDGIDVYVGLSGHLPPPTRLFVVQVKGTVSADPGDWVRTTKTFFRSGSHLYLPACVFVINVRDNTTRYAWIAEPIAEPDRAVLKFHPTPAFHELTDAAVTDVVGRVRAYYDAVPKQLLPTG